MDFKSSKIQFIFRIYFINTNVIPVTFSGPDCFQVAFLETSTKSVKYQLFFRGIVYQADNETLNKHNLKITIRLLERVYKAETRDEPCLTTEVCEEQMIAVGTYSLY